LFDDMAEKAQYISMIHDYLDTLSDEAIRKMRIKFEVTNAGKQAIRENPERRLYAVLRPNREENIKRIIAALERERINFLKVFCRHCGLLV